MRDLIVRALLHVLAGLTAAAHRTDPGRHSARYLSARIADGSPTPVGVSAWSRPWTTPSSADAREIWANVKPGLSREQQERRWALEFAARGADYPYGYPGDHFDAVEGAA